MTDNMIELAKRAVACKGWRWMRGMNTTTGDTFIAFSDCDGAYWLALLPDLTNPATLGCLLALVRVAYADPYASVWYSSDHGHSGDRWSFYSKALCFSAHASEAEALVAALEAAP